MLTVWGRKTSSNVQALMWCIGELGLRFSRHDIGHKYGGQDTPEFLAMNPNGTVPVLKDGDGEPALGDRRHPALSQQPLGWCALLAAGTGGSHPRRQMGGMVQDQHRAQFHGSDILACGAYRAGASRRGRDRRGRWCPRQQARHRRAPGLAPRLSRRGRFHARRHPVRPPALSLFRHRNRSPQPSGPATLLRQADRAAGLPAACDGVV
jgi:hypothetical protein